MRSFRSGLPRKALFSSMLLVALAILRPTLAADTAPVAANRLAGVQAVEHALAMMVEGWKTRDANVLSSRDIYFSDDTSKDEYVLYDVMPPFVDAGYKNLFEKNVKYFAATEGPTEVYWTDKHIDSDGEFAFFRGIMHAKAKYKDGRSLDFVLRHTLVLKKFGDKFLIVHEHASVPDAVVGIETPTKK
jgi:ketosteroid isomerase-like protein